MASKEKELERVLKALANQRRLTILIYLRSGKEAAVGDIANHLKLSFKATSKHISVLAAAGIVEKEQQSKVVLSSLSSGMPEVARAVLKLL